MREGEVEAGARKEVDEKESPPSVVPEKAFLAVVER
jgi:hypothetical protein